MRTFHIPSRRLEREPEFSSPWAEGHASPEDRALGHELELIELQRRLDEAPAGSTTARRIEAEMASVRDELARVAGLPDLRHVA